MNYCAIYKQDIINGLGVRVSLFVSGCTHKCPGCFNQKAWNENYGKEYTQETEDLIMEYLKEPYIDGLSLLGGEPMEVTHQKDICKLVTRVRKELPEKNIWLYSGYTLEELTSDKVKTEFTDTILRSIDVLVDGEFIQAQKDVELPFRGSSNQRLIAMKRTMNSDHVYTLEL